MRIRLLITSFLFFFLLPTAFAKKKTTPLPAPPHSTTSGNYVSALATANRFLQAWQTEDHEAGLLLLTDAAKHQVSEERLEKLLSPEVSVPRGYQIVRGKRLNDRRYSFAVTLFEASAGARKAVRVRNAQIVVVQTGKEDWAVDKLP